MIKRLFGLAWNSNLLTAWGGQSVGVLRFLILTPIVLTRFSDAEIAIYFLFGTVLSFAQLLDLGMAPTLTRYFAYASAGAPDLDSLIAKKRTEHGVPNWDLIGRIFSISGYIYLCISALVFVLVGGLATLAIAHPIGHLQDPDEGWRTWGVIVVSVLYISYSARYRIYLRGRGQLALEQRIFAIIALLSLVGATVVLVSTESLFWTFLTLQLSSVFGGFLMMFIAYQSESRRLLSLPAFAWDRELFDHISGPCWKTAVAVSASVGTNRLSGLLLAQFISPEALAPFLFAQRVIDFSIQFLSTPVLVLQPILPRLRAQGKVVEIASMMEKRIFFSLGCLSLWVGAFSLLGPWFLRIIGSEVGFLGSVEWIFYILFILYDRLCAYITMIHMSTNQIYFWRHSLIYALSTLLLSLSLVPEFGILGFLVSILFSRVVVYRLEPLKKAAESLDSIPPLQFLFRCSLLAACPLILTATFHLILN